VNTLFDLPNSSGRSRQGRFGRDQAQHGVHEQPIVRAEPAFVAFLAWNKGLNPPPFSARRTKVALPECDLESYSRVGGNPLNVNRT
jgi:hypothetical protein